MSFVDLCIKNRALETFMGPYFGPGHLLLLRATCRGLRACIKPHEGRAIDILAKSGFYWLVLNYFGDVVPTKNYLCFECSGRDIWAQKSLIKIHQIDLSGAIYSGNLELLKWFHTQKSERKDHACASAAYYGQLTILKWLRANNYYWDEWTCAYAAKNGHLEVIKWARANGAPWDEWTCMIAAERGHLGILKWAWANGCPLGPHTFKKAVSNNRSEIVEWLRANGCPEN